MRASGRFLMYGVAGWSSEVTATGLRSHGRDGTWRLTGYTYLWMLPIYGGAALVAEPVQDAMARAGWPTWARGVAYAGGIYVVEAASGTALRRLTGEIPWDYRRPRGTKPVPRNWRGLVRPAYFPQWVLVGLGLEQLHELLDRTTVLPAGGPAVGTAV